MNVIIRHELAGDWARITKINDIAFDQGKESILVKKLRGTREYVRELSLVAEVDKKIVGHLLLYPIYLVSDKIKYKTLTLSPVALHPEYKDSGIEDRLINRGIEVSREKGYFSIVAMGRPEYYPKFGFKRASAYHIRSPFKVSDNAFMALELVSGALDNVPGKVEYPEPYYKCAI